MKTQILSLVLALILCVSCSQDDSVTNAEESDVQNSVVGTSFLTDPNGNPIGGNGQDCSSYIPPTVGGNNLCAFPVYYRSFLTQEEIACTRKEYFMNNPNLRLYIGQRPLSLSPNAEWWVFISDINCGGPTDGRTPVNGSNQDTDTDSRVCVRRPCE